MNDQLIVRRKKMDELRAMNVDPFGEKFDRQDLARTLNEKYIQEDKEELNDDMPQTRVAGRMLAKRGKGKVDLQIFTIVQAKFKFMFAKTLLVKRITKF